MPKKGEKATPAQLAALELGRAKPGEARRRPVDELLPDEAAIRDDVVANLPPGKPSQRERSLAALIAPVKVQENRAHAWMAANRRNASANAWRKIELAARCSRPGYRIDHDYRWWVRPHWRRQWYPKQQRHRPILIAGHARGPADKPLLMRDRAWWSASHASPIPAT